MVLIRRAATKAKFKVSCAGSVSIQRASARTDRQLQQGCSDHSQKLGLAHIGLGLVLAVFSGRRDAARAHGAVCPSQLKTHSEDPETAE